MTKREKARIAEAVTAEREAILKMVASFDYFEFHPSGSYRQLVDKLDLVAAIRARGEINEG